MLKLISRSYKRLKQPEFRPVILLGFAAFAVFLFASIAEEVLEKETLAFDRAVLEAMRDEGPGDPVGPDWLEDMARDLTSFGSTGVLVFVVAAAGFYLWLARKRASAAFLIAAIVAGTVISTGLKELFARSRPDEIYQATPVFTASFPSGHSFLSAVTYLTLGALLARSQPRRRLKAFIMGTAIVMVLLVGVTRAYLGVHWTTDVVGGWILGAGWAAAAWAVMLILQREHKVEAAEETYDEIEDA